MPTILSCFVTAEFSQTQGDGQDLVAWYTYANEENHIGHTTTASRPYQSLAQQIAVLSHAGMMTAWPPLAESNGQA